MSVRRKGGVGSGSGERPCFEAAGVQSEGGGDGIGEGLGGWGAQCQERGELGNAMTLSTYTAGVYVKSYFLL